MSEVTAFARLAQRARRAVEDTELDLSEMRVLTEAATGHYACTAPIAALAGAGEVVAVAGSSRYGSAEDAMRDVRRLAYALGVDRRVHLTTARSGPWLREVDIVTNSGHVRPIDRRILSCLKPTAVVPLMYEAWELRASDVDVQACEDLGIAVAGTNEEDPRVGVFSYLGVLALKQLLQAGVEVRGCRILLLCNNRFAPHILSMLRAAGADVIVAGEGNDKALADDAVRDLDALLVAMTPEPGSAFVGPDRELVPAQRLAALSPGCTVCQFWGDLDRVALEGAGLSCYPVCPPAPGHMGILLSDLGPTPIVRLQTGGLKVGELLARARRSGRSRAEAVQFAVARGFAQALNRGTA
jgi:hypothetical protein